MFVKPKYGRLVSDPDRNDLLPEEGREVVEQQYWLRRLEDDDIELIEAIDDNPIED